MPWKPAIDKIIKGILAFKSLGDALVAFDKSGYAALGWSVVSLGLQVAANAETAREFVLSSSEIITGHMERYAKFEIHLRGPESDDGFDRCVKNVYKAMLLYMMALHDYLGKCEAGHLMRGVFKPEELSVSKNKEAVDEANTEVMNWLHFLGIKLVRNIATYNNQPEPSSPPQDWLKSLAFPQMDSRSHEIDDAADRTCEWLHRHDAYKSWVTCDRSLLWIKGKPGSGKSTLLRYALDNTKAVSDIEGNALVLSFFFHGRGIELQKTPLGLFRSLLHQLLSQVPSESSDLVATFQQRRDSRGEPGKEWQWHLRELQGFFKSSLLKVLDNHPVHLFIDALDECGQKDAVGLVANLKALLELPSTRFQFRICFACRHYPNLDHDSELKISLEQENKSDISTYVRARLSASLGLKASKVPDLITERADGVFMWARLVIEDVL